MKNIKKILALLVAVMMIAVSMGAFAAANDLTADSSLTISGLAAGDTVNLYKVLQWVDGTGWALTEKFASCTDVLAHINAGTALNNDDIAALTAAANGGASAWDSQTLSGDTYSKTSDVEAGMYLALVAPADAKTVYNPIIVSADFNGDNSSNTISSSDSIPTSGAAVAKKSTVTVKKEADEYTLDSGDEAAHKEPVSFTITTTIPAYSKGYTAPIFRVKDQLSTGLKLKEDSLTITSGDVGYGTPTTSATGFTITFDPDDILALAAPQAVTITYQAYFTNEAPYTVNEEDNDVTVEFSNNPDNESDVNIIKDKTRHYTFSIDGSLFGNDSYQTGEVVKIGVDSQGTVIESYKELDNGSSHGALAGATFGLYKSKTDADAGNENYYTNAVFAGTVTTDGNGLMEINGLDAGTYYLKELSAPSGYIKDQNTHTIIITADIDGDEDGEEGELITETVDGKEITYRVPVLRGYTITVDGNESSYTMTLDGPEISSVTPGDSSTEIVNTKGVELPSTGGVGTTIFYVGGSILVLAAVILLVTKRRMSAGE